MLGINNLVKRGGGVRSIIKKGLQAWYKADKTQAPLGEEEVANSVFSVGVEENVNGDFKNSGYVNTTSQSLGWYQIGTYGGGSAIGNGELALKGKSGGTKPEEYSRVYLSTNGINSSALTVDKTYKLTYTISSISGSIDLDYHNGDTWLNTLPATVGTHTVYYTQTTNQSFILRNNGGNGSEIKFSNISIQQTNPNDSWVSDTATGGTVTFKDGSVDIVTDGAGAGIQQVDVFTVGKKYEVIVDATITSGAGVKVGSDNDYDNIIDVISTTGVVTGTFVATHANFRIHREGSSAGNYTINSVSIKEITNSVRDYSKNSNNATLYSGTALDFDGTNDYVTLDYPATGTTVDNNFKCTIALWFNADTLGQKMIFSTAQGPSGSNDQHNRFYLWTNESKLYFNFGDQSGSPTTGTAPSIVADRWYRVVIAVDGLTAYVYLDGELQYTRTSAAFDQPTLSSNLTLGRHGSTSSYYYDGMISDFQAYDTCWSFTDVEYDWENPDKDVFDNEPKDQELSGELQLNDFTTSLSDGTTWSLDNAGSGDYAPELNDGVLKLNSDMYSTEPESTAYLGSSNGIFELGSYYIISGALKNFNSTLGVSVEWVDKSGSQTIISNDGELVTGFADWVEFTSEPVQVLELLPAQLKLNVWNPDDGTSPNNYGYFKDISIKKVLTHKVEILPSDCKTLLRLNEGAGDRVYNAAPVLGANLIGNSDFSSDVSSWVAGGSGTIEHVTSFGGRSNVAKITTPTTYHNDNKAYHTFTAIPNAIYEVKLDVYVVSGQLRVDGLNADLTGDAGLEDIIHQGVTSGWVTVSGIATGESSADASTQLWIRAQLDSSDLECYVDNVSVKEISLSDSYAFVGSPAWAPAQPYIPQLAMSSYSKKIVFTDIDTDVDVGAQSIADGQAFSFSFWYAQTDDSSLENYILAKHDSTNDYIRINNQNQSLEFKIDGSTTVTYDINDLTDFKISHIVLTRASGANAITKCYVNGILEVTDSSGNADGVFEYQQIGAGGSSNAGTFFLDELAHFNKELSLEEVIEIFNAGTALDCRDHSAASDLEGYWRNNSTDQWDDLSTNSNNGTVNGSPTTIQLQEVPYFKRDSLGLPMNRVRQRALNLDGNSYLKIDDDTSLDVAGTNEITIELWYKANSAASYDANQYLVASEGWSNAGGFSLLATATDITWTCEKADDSDPDAEAKFTHGDSTDWVHVVATYDEQNLKLYKNAALNGSDHTFATTSALVDEYPIYIGSLDGGANYWCDGIIDDVKIYNRVLSSSEVKRNYNATKSKHSSASNWSDDFDESFV